jgi:hypothetical protein
LAILFSIAAMLAFPARAVADDNDALFAEATAALAEGRAGDAITDFEALADRGVVDGTVSFDRGLAYATRVKIGAEQPGDLGRAAHGFEEARALTSDTKLARDATQALGVIRAEVARRRIRAGESADVEQLVVGRSIVRLLSEDAWCIAAVVASVALGAALFVRMFVSSRRGKVGATIGWAVAAPALALSAAMVLFARDDRLHVREAVIVAPQARVASEKGIVIDDIKALPEAALVEVVETKPGWARIKWGTIEGWIPSSTVRSIARRE